MWPRSLTEAVLEAHNDWQQSHRGWYDLARAMQAKGFHDAAEAMQHIAAKESAECRRNIGVDS